MKIWNKYRSLSLSYVMVKVLLALIVIGAILIPYAVGMYFRGMEMTETVRQIRLALTISLYVSVIPAFASVFMLDRMLHNIKNDVVFDAKNVEYLRYISWCCYITGTIYFVLGFFILLSFSIAVASTFFGLIVRVIKNVFCEAVEIKTENDMTI